MTDEERNHEALFRHAILGDVLSRNLRRGQLRPALKQLAQQTYEDHHGRSRRVAHKTLEEWYYKYRNGGFEALKPRPRKDRNSSRVLAEDLQQLILDMKREDPGRSAHLILPKRTWTVRFWILRHLCGPTLKGRAACCRKPDGTRWRDLFKSRPTKSMAASALRARSVRTRRWIRPARIR